MRRWANLLILLCGLSASELAAPPAKLVEIGNEAVALGRALRQKGESVLRMDELSARAGAVFGSLHDAPPMIARDVDGGDVAPFAELLESIMRNRAELLRRVAKRVVDASELIRDYDETTLNCRSLDGRTLEYVSRRLLRETQRVVLQPNAAFMGLPVSSNMNDSVHLLPDGMAVVDGSSSSRTLAASMCLSALIADEFNSNPSYSALPVRCDGW